MSGRGVHVSIWGGSVARAELPPVVVVAVLPAMASVTAAPAAHPDLLLVAAPSRTGCLLRYCGHSEPTVQVSLVKRTLRRVTAGTRHREELPEGQPCLDALRRHFGIELDAPYEALPPFPRPAGRSGCACRPRRRPGAASSAPRRSSPAASFSGATTASRTPCASRGRSRTDGAPHPAHGLQWDPVTAVPASEAGRDGPRGLTQTQQPPENPGRFSPRTGAGCG